MRIRSAARSLATATLTALALVVTPAAADTTAAKKPEPAKTTSHVAAKSSKTAKKPAPKASHKATSKASKPHKGRKKLPRKPGSTAGEPDEATRRIIAGTNGPAVAPDARRAESPELRAIRELDRALFPSPSPSAMPWPVDTLPLDPEKPRVLATGVPPAGELGAAPSPVVEAPHDLSWLRTLDMPDIPVRWDARVLRYLEFYRDNPRGRSMVAGWVSRQRPP